MITNIYPLSLMVFAGLISLAAAPIPEAASFAGSKGKNADADIQKLITQLGSTNDKVREKAKRTLVGLGPVAVPLLKKAADSNNLDIGFEATIILRAIDRNVREKAFHAHVAQMAPHGIDLYFDRLLARRDKLKDADWQAIAKLIDAIAFKADAQKWSQFDISGPKWVKWHLVKGNTVDEKWALVRKRVVAESVSVGSHAVDSFILSTGPVQPRPGLGDCVVFANGNIKTVGAVAASIIVCASDVVIDGQIMQSVIIANGNVKVGAHVTESLIISNCNVTVDSMVGESRIIAKGSVHVDAYVRDSVIKHGQPQPLKLFRFFDPATLGLDLTAPSRKVYVAKVKAGTSFARAGLQPKDLIAAVNGIRPDSYAECRHLLRRAVALGKAVLRIRRGDKSVNVPIVFPPEKRPKKGEKTKKKEAPQDGSKRKKAEADIKKLIAQLGDANEKARAIACYALFDLGPVAVPLLKKALASDNAHIRRGANAVLRALDRRAREKDLRDRVAQPPKRRKEDEKKDIRKQPTAPPAGSKDKKANAQIQKLISHLGSSNKKIRAVAAQTLLALGKDSVPLLKRAADSDDADIRFEAKALLRAIDRMIRERNHSAHIAKLIPDGIDLYFDRLLARRDRLKEADWQDIAKLIDAIALKAGADRWRPFTVSGPKWVKFDLVNGKKVTAKLSLLDKRVLADSVSVQFQSCDSLMVCAGSVETGSILGDCVVFANGNVKINNSMVAGSIIVCTGDVEVINGQVTESVIITHGNVRVDGFVANSCIVAKGSVRFVGFARSSIVQEHQAHPLKLFRFFDPAAQGLELTSQGRKVMAAKVKAGSPFAFAGLQPKDVIAAVDENRLNSLEQCRGLLRRAIAKGKAVLRVRRGDKSVEAPVVFSK